MGTTHLSTVLAVCKQKSAGRIYGGRGKLSYLNADIGGDLGEAHRLID